MTKAHRLRLIDEKAAWLARMYDTFATLTFDLDKHEWANRPTRVRWAAKRFLDENGLCGRYDAVVEGHVAYDGFHVHALLQSAGVDLDLLERKWRTRYGIADFRPAARSTLREQRRLLPLAGAEAYKAKERDHYIYFAKKTLYDGLLGDRVFA